MSATVSNNVLVPGEVLGVSGTGWLPGSTVTICLFSSPVLLGTATVDGNGNFRTTVRIPTSVDPGEHTLVMAGLDADSLPREVSIPLTIVPTDGDEDTPSDPDRPGTIGLFPDLPATGGGPITLGVRALLLLLTGGSALYVSRRRPAGWLRS